MRESPSTFTDANQRCQDLEANDPDVVSCGSAKQLLWRRRCVQNTASTWHLQYKPLRVSNHKGMRR